MGEQKSYEALPGSRQIEILLGQIEFHTAKSRRVPARFEEDYEDYVPIELKDNAAPAEVWVSRLYRNGSVANGLERLRAMKEHPEGNPHVVFVPRGDVQELYEAYKQDDEFRADLRRSRTGLRDRPRLIFPLFVPPGLRTPDPLD